MTMISNSISTRSDPGCEFTSLGSPSALRGVSTENDMRRLARGWWWLWQGGGGGVGQSHQRLSIILIVVRGCMPCNDFSLRMNWISKKWRERENLSTGDVRWVALNRWLVHSLFKQKWNGGLGIFLTNNNVHSLPWRVSQQRNLIMLIAVINIWEQNRILQRCFVVVDQNQQQE